MKFRYRGYTQSGTLVGGIFQAANRLAAMDTALAGTFVLTRLDLAVPREGIWRVLTRDHGTPRPAEMSHFFRQLGSAIAIGVPVATALNLQFQHGGGRLREVLESLHADILCGRVLSEAMRRRHAFPQLAVHVIQAGEATGELAAACRRVAMQIETEAALRGRVTRAMMYPLILCSLLLAGGAVLAGFVFPRLMPALEGLGVPLPLPTHVLVVVTEWVQHHWRNLLAVAGLTSAGLTVLLNTGPGKTARDRLVWSVPLLGPITRSAAAARFCRTLATVLRTGTPFAATWELLAASTGNRHLQSRLLPVLRRVLDGADLANTFAGAAVLPRLAVQALAAGAATGTLADAADQAAGYYEEATNGAIGVMTEALSPLVTVLIALAVLFVALGVYLPMVGIIQHIR